MMGDKIETRQISAQVQQSHLRERLKKGVQIYNRNERKRTILYTATQFPAGV